MPRKAISKANGVVVALDAVSSTTNAGLPDNEPPIVIRNGRGKKSATPDAEEVEKVVKKAAGGRSRKNAVTEEKDAKEPAAAVQKATAKGRGKKVAADEQAPEKLEEVELNEKERPKPKAGRGKKAATVPEEVTPVSDELKAEEVQQEVEVKESKSVGKGRKRKEPTPVVEANGVEKKSQPKKRATGKISTEAVIEEKPAAAEIEEDVKVAEKPKKSSVKSKKLIEPLPEEQPEEDIADKPTTKRGRGQKTPNYKEVEENGEQATRSGRSGRNTKKKVKADNIELEKETKVVADKKKKLKKPVEEEDIQDAEMAEEVAAADAPAAAEKKPRGPRKRAVIDEHDDEADGAKPSKAKKNATETNYNAEDFELPAEKDSYNLKISSWNVAGLRAWVKKDGLKFLEYEKPDIFCLQEIKCTTDQLPEEVAPIPGYHPYWLCMPGGHAGVAIYSKIMPINVSYGIGNAEFDSDGHMITAEYEKFYLINAYVPNSGRKLVNLEPRMRWEEHFKAYVHKLDALKPVIVCGDMNVSHLEIDLANPKSNTRNAGFTKEERDKMSELLALGFVDTFRHLYPQRTGAYTFWTYMGNARARNVGWRLDYYIVSQRFMSRVVENCIRAQCLGSDHCPITLFLKL